MQSSRPQLEQDPTGYPVPQLQHLEVNCPIRRLGRTRGLLRWAKTDLVAEAGALAERVLQIRRDLEQFSTVNHSFLVLAHYMFMFLH